MSDPSELRLGLARPLESPSSPGPDWARLLGRRSAHEALEEIGRWLAPDVTDLVLEPGASAVVHWTAEEGRVSEATFSQDIGGSPPWRLGVGLARAVAELPSAAAARAGMALGAWRAAREGADRSERHLSARSRELDLLSALGRRAAEAHDLPALFSGAVAVLAPALDLDLTLAAWREDNEVSLELYAARPFSEQCGAELEDRMRRFLGESGSGTGKARLHRLEGWDAARGTRRELREEDLLLLPLVRRDAPVACLVAVANLGLAEERMRPLYGAASLLSLHLERILAVREAEADRFRTIVDSMPQGVVLVDAELRAVSMNRSAAHLFQSIGLTQDDDLVGLLAERGLGDTAARVAAGEAGTSEAEIHPEPGKTWSVTVSAFRSVRGGFEGIVLVVADVTERRRMQERLAQAEKMSSLGQMISGVAHELNNPLASILGYTQLLRLKGPDDRLLERLETLSREAERCRKIVQSLLSFARWRAAEHKPLALNDVVRSVLDLLAYQLRVDDVGVTLDLDRNLPVMHGDAHQLEQMLVNLLTNARHAIRETGRSGTVTIRTTPGEPTGLRLEIGDDGPGISHGLRERIFDPFFTTKRAGQGTGLGLALVYSIVTAHGGTIDVGENTPCGVTFTVKLPLGRPSATTTDAVVSSSPSSVEPRRGRILVVDDEEPLARLICDALEHDGHSTSSVSDGRQALTRLASEEFDLIVSDVRMPGLQVERLLEEVRALRPLLARRMLLTTGDTLGSGAQEAAARTGLEVLSKPFDLAELRRSVHARLAVDD